MIPLFDLKRQVRSVQPGISNAVQDVLESGEYIGGNAVGGFERMAASYLSVDHAVGVANGTDALILALQGLGIGPGDEVIVPAFTFWGTVEAVLRVGAIPVLVDIEPDSLCLDPHKIQAAITRKTKAIITVDLYGLRANIGKLYDLSRTYEISIIEDAAQAFGSTWEETYPGHYVKAACFSFFPTKPLGCAGDGGMVVTNDTDLADKVRMLRSHGWKEKYKPELVGYNSRLDAIQAVILTEKLPYVNQWTERRRAIAEYYNSRFRPLAANGAFKLPEDATGHAWHLYTLQVRDRDSVKRKLEDAGVSCGVYYPLVIHQTKIGAKYYKGVYVNAEKAAKQVLSIPCFAELSFDETEFVADAVISCL